MKSRFTVVSSSSDAPWLRAIATALRNTSGNTTADPQFRYTPPLSRATFDTKYRKSRRLPSPSAAPDARAMHVNDVGADRHVHGHRNLQARGRRDDAQRFVRGLHLAQPAPDRLTQARVRCSTPSLIAAFSSSPVSSAIPKRPGPSASSTSSDVPPESASSKS